MSSPEPALTAESELAASLMLDRELVRNARARILTEGEHWQKKGVTIMLTNAGIAALMDHFAVSKGDCQPPPDSPKPELLTVIVTQQVPNPRQVLCRRENEPLGAKSIVLRVPTTTEGGREVNFFTPGLRVRGRHVEGAIYDYQGPRPRFRGDPLILAPEQPIAPTSAVTIPSTPASSAETQ